MVWGAGITQLVEHRTHVMKVPSSSPSTEVAMIGCAICTLTVQLSSLIGQYQPMLARLLQHYTLPVLMVSSFHKLTRCYMSYIIFKATLNPKYLK